MNLDAALTLVITELCLDRGGRRVLSGISAKVAGGEALVVTGRNGAGKSTLLRAIAGLLPVAGGTIALGGGDPREGADPEQMHLIGHRNAMKPQFTVIQNAHFWAGWQGGADGAMTRAEDALETVGLLELADSPAEFLSQGQLRRLALARLAAAPRPLWLLDEPVAGLDAASRAMFAQMMHAHLGGGNMIVAATHEALGLEAARGLTL
ncbi:MAG: heme ABC exporter ATP-binding protein CcmA [Pseudomonadota bacterium]